MILLWLIVAALVSVGIVSDNLALIAVGLVVAALAFSTRKFWKFAAISLVLAASVFVADGGSVGSLGPTEILVVGTVAGFAVVALGLAGIVSKGPLAGLTKKQGGRDE